MSFVPRLTRPEAGNKYYITKASGGYSNAIKGSPTDPSCDVLSNCVGYAYGRFNEIGQWGSCKYLAPVNAENFIQYKGDLEVGMEPRLGACMVWQKGATLSGSDGAGHVAIVEKINSDTELVTSESGWGYNPFWTQTRKKGSDGNWGQGSDFKFLGFIYNPAACCKKSGGVNAAMSNSPLVNYTCISPNKNSPRTHAIDRITIHCVVGQCTVETLGNIFAPTSRQASSNYGVGYDGRIGMYVEEKDRSWCSSSAENDHRAITIETASDTFAPYAVTTAAYNALIQLCADICKRNGKTKMVWLGDKDKTLAYTPAPNEMVMTVHRWFAATACPGDYLLQRQADIANKVNAILNPTPAVKPEPTPPKEEEKEMVYYKTINDVPEWYLPTIKKLVDKGALKGTGDGLNISDDFCRIVVILDRLGKLD